MRRWWQDRFARAGRVIEPELDMERRVAQKPFSILRLIEWLRWLTPTARPLGPPARSVDRDLEESWPSGER